VLAAWVLDNGEVATHVTDYRSRVLGACLAERVEVADTPSTIQGTPIAVAPVDAIALESVSYHIDRFRLTW
jgi:Na+-translocating ferredoxin:NAD+ oxidoreductase RnfA subunit